MKFPWNEVTRPTAFWDPRANSLNGAVFEQEGSIKDLLKNPSGMHQHDAIKILMIGLIMVMNRIEEMENAGEAKIEK